MKGLKLLLISGLILLSSVVTYAQKEDDPDWIYTNIDENDKHIRGSYLTNPWYSNWSVALQGGVQTLVSGTDEHNQGVDFGTAKLTPSFELDIAKWFTPVIGVRFAFQGVTAKEKRADYNAWFSNHYPLKREGDCNLFNLMNLHIDLMWNFVNTIWGYRANRFYNIAPYAKLSYMRLSHPDESYFTNKSRDREFVFGFGLYNTFRITNALQATVDLRWGNLSGRYHDVSDGGRVQHFTAMAGVAYNIEKWYWTRSKGIEQARDAAQTEAMQAVASLNQAKKENEELQRMIVELNSHPLQSQVVAVPTTDFRERVANADLVLYYQINVSKLNFSEENHLNTYVTETLAADPKHVFYLTGSADKGTGTLEINTRLSNERAQGVRNILMNKYNVPEDQIVIKATIVSDKHEDGGLDRCVLIEKE